MCNACQLSHTQGLASSAFARHYSRNHNCFLFLRVLRCFTSPRSLQLPYIFRQRLPDMTPVFQGFPIRTSSDQSSFTNSPRLIAGYNVLLRLLVPRHPPIALSSLLIYKDARVHCEVLKIRARPTNQHPQQASTNRFTQKSRRTMRPTLQNPTACSGKDPPTKLSTPPKRRLYSPATASLHLPINVPQSGACPAEDKRSGTRQKWTEHTKCPAMAP